MLKDKTIEENHKIDSGECQEGVILMQYSNLHTHTTYSDGKHSIEENIQSALKKNMLSIGFSDHSFTACDPGYCMPYEKYGEYLAEIRKMEEKYRGKIQVFSGLELDYYSASQEEIQRYPFDPDAFHYIIASVHYIIKNGICYPIDHTPEQQKRCITEAFGGDIYAMAQCYFDMVCEHVERVRPTLVGHFDVITKFSLMPENDVRYQKIASEALKRVLKTCRYIEVNTGAISRGWRTSPYPNTYLFETLLKEGGEVVLSSDSHKTENLTFYFDETVQMLKKFGFDHIGAFNGRGFDVQKI